MLSGSGGNDLQRVAGRRELEAVEADLLAGRVIAIVVADPLDQRSTSCVFQCGSPASEAIAADCRPRADVAIDLHRLRPSAPGSAMPRNPCVDSVSSIIWMIAPNSCVPSMSSLTPSTRAFPTKVSNVVRSIAVASNRRWKWGRRGRRPSGARRLLSRSAGEAAVQLRGLRVARAGYGQGEGRGQRDKGATCRHRDS